MSDVGKRKASKNDNDKQIAIKESETDDDKALVEFEPKDDNDCDTEAITKEEEWITKRKTELTTTRQIETRVKRQVVLEDGKVVEDSGPIVSTNTTEDTDKQETETTEKRDLGIPEESLTNVTSGAIRSSDCVDGGQLAELDDNGQRGIIVKKMVPRPVDGLVREINEKRVVSREEVKDYLELEDVRHLGDFSDETYVQTVNSGIENLGEALTTAAENQRQLVPLGPRVVANTSKSFKTIDSEDTQKRSLAQADGKIITENKKTTEHEVIVDKPLPEKDDQSTGSREKVTTVEASQRYYKQRDEQNVDIIADVKVIDTEMRYAAETMQIEKDGSLERPGDWDSLSDRMRKLRRPHQKTLLQQHKAALLADRKDALTKRPLDFDREEETRKGETMKWLESHFGSESTASNDSRDDDAEVEPTKKTFFNVTIKSNQNQTQPPVANATTNGFRSANTHTEKKFAKVVEAHATNGSNGGAKYYQGISNWAERKEAPANHFASKAFREDLQETVARNRLRKGETHSSRDKINENRYLGRESSDTYVSREDIIHQKRQSLSSQFLAKSARASRDKLDDLDANPERNREALARNITGSRNDVRYERSTPDESKHLYPSNGRIDNDMRRSPTAFKVSTVPRKYGYKEERTKSYERELYGNVREAYDMKTVNTLRPSKSRDRSPSPEVLAPLQTSTLGRPTVPQRKRAIEKKLRQQNSTSPPPLKVPLDHQRDVIEPPPDYSPPPRSRSSSPQIDYGQGAKARLKSSRENMVDATAYEPHIVNASTLTRKQNQRTRFAPTIPSSTAYHPGTHPTLRPATATQTTQTTPSTISTSTATSHKSSRVGQVIGNSIRKLVNKIRSASAERKMRMKSRSKSREQSPSPHGAEKPSNGSATTYQQYNVIDSHIGGQPASNESELESMQTHSLVAGKAYNSQAPVERTQDFRRSNSADPFAGERDNDHVTSPRQRYYLGEDPYSSTLYGKENIYGPGSIGKRGGQVRDPADVGYANAPQGNNRDVGMVKRDDGGDYHKQSRNISSSTLGRYQKAGQRFAGSTPNLNHQDYRTTQTLPRKLHDHHAQPQQTQQYQKAPQRLIGNGHSVMEHGENRSPYQAPLQNVGPAKPARTYAKALNRSKSFNVHAMNGSNDPSPIYIEKLTKNNYATSNLQTSQTYKSNPHLYSGSKENSLLQSGLKSPSIVNLISRSQKDLSRIESMEDEQDSIGPMYSIHAPGQVPTGGKLMQREEKKQLFLKNLHQQAPDLYRSLHGDDDLGVPTKYQTRSRHGLDTRSPIEINKDTASIIRRDSSSNDDYVTSYAYGKSNEMSAIRRGGAYKEEALKRRAPGPTIISVRGNLDSRK